MPRLALLLLALLFVKTAKTDEVCKNRVARGQADYMGGKKIKGHVPKGLEGFVVFWVEFKRPDNYKGNYQDLLTPDLAGKIPVAGRMVFKDPPSSHQEYRFEAAKLVERNCDPVELIFPTEQKNGVSYRFVGRYLESPETTLEGTLSRQYQGRDSFRAKLKFKAWNVVE